MQEDEYPCCLTIAGSDSGGNAGIQADLRTFHSYSLHGCTVFTALTAQNPSEVSAILPVHPGFIEAQLKAVLGHYSIRAVKTGMLPTAEAVAAVAGALRLFNDIPLVVDPVMVATSGAKLGRGDVLPAMLKELFPIATLVTPNLPEAELLLQGKISPDNVDDAARCLSQLYHCAILIKGGHGDGGESVDVLCERDRVEHFALPRIVNPVSVHGTGCTLSAAIAAELALGATLPEAVAGAKRFVFDSIAASRRCGRHAGVLGFAIPRRAGSNKE